MKYFECQEIHCGNICTEKTALKVASGVQVGVFLLKCPYCRGRLTQVDVFHSKYIQRGNTDASSAGYIGTMGDVGYG